VRRDNGNGVLDVITLSSKPLPGGDPRRRWTDNPAFRAVPYTGRAQILAEFRSAGTEVAYISKTCLSPVHLRPGVPGTPYRNPKLTGRLGPRGGGEGYTLSGPRRTGTGIGPCREPLEWTGILQGARPRGNQSDCMGYCGLDFFLTLQSRMRPG